MGQDGTGDEGRGGEGVGRDRRGQDRCCPHHTLTCSPAHPSGSIVTSWIDKRTVKSEKTHCMILFDKYLPACFEKLKSGFKRITPVPEVTVIQMLLYLLECLLTPQTVPPDSPRELYELYFVFACVWAFGGALFQDQVRLRDQPLGSCPPTGASRQRHPSAASPPKTLKQLTGRFLRVFCVVPPSLWITAWSSASGG